MAHHMSQIAAVYGKQPTIQQRQSALLIKNGSSLVLGGESDQKIIQVIDVWFPQKMQTDTLQWIAGVFRPFLISILNEENGVEFVKLIRAGGG
jgi:hypothetical protein